MTQWCKFNTLAPLGFYMTSAFSAHTSQLPNVNGVEEEEEEEEKEGGGWGEVVFVSPKVGGVKENEEEEKSIWGPMIPPQGTMGKKVHLKTHALQGVWVKTKSKWLMMKI